jgi:hypothetical protein
MRSRPVADVVLAAAAGAALAGAPSTLITLARREDLLDGARAAGTILLPREARGGVLLAAAVPVHLGLSLGWAAVLAALAPPRDEAAWGLLGGLAIAALDLGLAARRFPAIRALPQGRQWADHVAFGVSVGAVLEWRRRRRAE